MRQRKEIGGTNRDMMERNMALTDSDHLINDYQKCDMKYGEETTVMAAHETYSRDFSHRQIFPVSYNKDNYYVRTLNGLRWKPNATLTGNLCCAVFIRRLL